MENIKENEWNTYDVHGFGYQAGPDPRASGGVHLLEVRHFRGRWYRRVTDSNGRFQSSGKSERVSDEMGEELFRIARCYNEED